MANAFGYVTSFNQPLVWDTSKVTNMAYMFKNDPNHCPEGACSFNQPLYWDVSNVKEMREMVTAAPLPPPPLHPSLSLSLSLSLIASVRPPPDAQFKGSPATCENLKKGQVPPPDVPAWHCD